MVESRKKSWDSPEKLVQDFATNHSMENHEKCWDIWDLYGIYDMKLK